VVKTLSTRTHKCPPCGYVADRDENAALNILKLALKEWAFSGGAHRISSLGERFPSARIVETQTNKGTRRKRKSNQ
jgi:putative transposase